MKKGTKTCTCSFFGHRKIDDAPSIKIKLHEAIENLIKEKGVYTFLFGSKSEFDELCHEVVTKLKIKYPEIKRIYVRAEYPYISDEYKDYLLQSYEDTYYPDRIINAGKAVYVERNYEMIDNSYVCIIYYNENYSVTKTKKVRGDVTTYKTKSGTKLVCDYAKKKKRTIINVFED